MKFYNKILLWENNRRLNKLAEFRGFVLDYFNNSRVEWTVDGRIEENEAKRARININRAVSEAYEIILNSGVSTIYTYTPPPMIGGRVIDLDLVQNVFNLDAVQIGPEKCYGYH